MMSGMDRRKKKSVKKGEIGEVLHIVNFIKDHMMTASEGKEMEERLSDRIDKVENKLSDRIDGVDSKAKGIQQSLDVERVERTDLKLPRRLRDVEEKVYGVGGSRHPKHISL